MHNLEHLIAAYFHEDWPEEYGTWEAGVDDFVMRAPARLSATTSEIDELLLACPEENDLAEALGAWGSAYRPDPGARAYRDWLLAVRDRIQAALDGSA